jgi:hypothetical protein
MPFFAKALAGLEGCPDSFLLVNLPSIPGLSKEVRFSGQKRVVVHFSSLFW